MQHTPSKHLSLPLSLCLCLFLSICNLFDSQKTWRFCKLWKVADRSRRWSEQKCQSNTNEPATVSSASATTTRTTKTTIETTSQFNNELKLPRCFAALKKRSTRHFSDIALIVRFSFDLQIVAYFSLWYVWMLVYVSVCVCVYVCVCVTYISWLADFNSIRTTLSWLPSDATSLTWFFFALHSQTYTSCTSNLTAY